MGACTDLPHRGLETGTATNFGPLPRTMIALGPLKGLGRSMDRVLANFSGSTAAVGGSTSARATAVRALSEAISRRRETDLYCIVYGINVSVVKAKVAARGALLVT